MLQFVHQLTFKTAHRSAYKQRAIYTQKSRNTSSSTGNASLRADFHFHNEMKMLDETKEESWKEDGGEPLDRGIEGSKVSEVER